MNKKQNDIFSAIIRLISTHPWLKLISLLLAIIVWFYAKGERI
ncbi:MAG TPA: hypothetical protein PL125_01705 [Candidatus Omnitrophota bacterium]|nr:hypothetical protein [Candidatus Omnitrophota bacterium]HPT38897.1 hypothetical protein [Candidatus Omnitrophota bacterium]